MNEGELSGRLGLPGWPAVAEEAIIARDVLLAAHIGSRLHVCHVSTAGLGRDASAGPRRRARRHRRGHARTTCCSPTTCSRGYDPVFKVNPPLRPSRGRRGAARRRSPTAPSTPSPPTTRRTPREDKELRVGRRGVRACSAWRPRSRSCSETMVDTGPARLGRRRRPDVGRARPASAGSPATAGRSRSGEPANLVARRPRGAASPSTADASLSLSRNTPYAGRTCPARVRRDLPARPADRPRRRAGMTRTESVLRDRPARPSVGCYACCTLAWRRACAPAWRRRPPGRSPSRRPPAGAADARRAGEPPLDGARRGRLRQRRPPPPRLARAGRRARPGRPQRRPRWPSRPARRELVRQGAAGRRLAAATGAGAARGRRAASAGQGGRRRRRAAWSSRWRATARRAATRGFRRRASPQTPARRTALVDRAVGQQHVPPHPDPEGDRT